MEQLLHDPGIWILFSFLIFIGVVRRPAISAFIRMLDARIEAIRKEVETARSLRAEAQALLEEYLAKSKAAHSEAEDITRRAKDHADRIRHHAETELSLALARREESLAARIRRMEEEALQDIRDQAAALTIEATARILAERLDEAAGQKLADRSMDDIARHVAH